MKDKYWDRQTFMEEYEVEPRMWVDVGALMGDKSDNIHGCPGVGEKWATKFVKQFGDVESVFEGLAAKGKLCKKEQAVLDNKEVIRLAKSLKAMDYIENLPGLRCATRNKGALMEWFEQFRFMSLRLDAWRLV